MYYVDFKDGNGTAWETISHTEADEQVWLSAGLDLIEFTKGDRPVSKLAEIVQYATYNMHYDEAYHRRMDGDYDAVLDFLARLETACENNEGTTIGVRY